MQQNRRGGSGWMGWLLFALIIFAPRAAGPLANWLSQVTGMNIAPGTLIAGLIGLYVVYVVLSPALRAVARSRSAGDTRLPSGPMSPPTSVSLPPPAQPRPSRARRSSSGSILPPSGPSPLPRPPRFEPIIDPRVLTFGLIGLGVLGAFFLLALFLVGALP